MKVERIILTEDKAEDLFLLYKNDALDAGISQRDAIDYGDIKSSIETGKSVRDDQVSRMKSIENKILQNRSDAETKAAANKTASDKAEADRLKSDNNARKLSVSKLKILDLAYDLFQSSKKEEAILLLRDNNYIRLANSLNGYDIKFIKGFLDSIKKQNFCDTNNTFMRVISSAQGERFLLGSKPYFMKLYNVLILSQMKKLSSLYINDPNSIIYDRNITRVVDDDDIVDIVLFDMNNANDRNIRSALKKSLPNGYKSIIGSENTSQSKLTKQTVDSIDKILKDKDRAAEFSSQLNKSTETKNKLKLLINP